jgi:hypothetical protein
MWRSVTWLLLLRKEPVWRKDVKMRDKSPPVPAAGIGVTVTGASIWDRSLIGLVFWPLTVSGFLTSSYMYWIKLHWGGPFQFLWIKASATLRRTKPNRNEMKWSETNKISRWWPKHERFRTRTEKHPRLFVSYTRLCTYTITYDLFQTFHQSPSIHYPLPLKVKVKFTLEQAMKAQGVSRGIALLFL